MTEQLAILDTGKFHGIRWKINDGVAHLEYGTFCEKINSTGRSVDCFIQWHRVPEVSGEIDAP